MKKGEAVKEKAKLEKKLNKELLEWYASVSKRVSEIIAEEGFVGTRLTGEEKERLSEILSDHYTRSVKANLPDEMINSKKEHIIRLAEKIIFQIEEDTKGTKANHENNIKTSTEKALLFLILLAFDEAGDLRGEDEEATNLGISKTFKNLARDRFSRKSRYESVFETNWISEKTRLTSETNISLELAVVGSSIISTALAGGDYSGAMREFRDIADLSERNRLSAMVDDVDGLLDAGDFDGTTASLAILTDFFKRWNTMGDDKVRDTHAFVDQSVIPVHDTFLVGASELGYPSDESYGADISEIANCRCFLTYE